METLIGTEIGQGGAHEPLIKETTTQNFMVDVIEASKNKPILVDFWAPWCGPCKQLTPIIEKAVKAAGGAVQLVKMNIDDHPAIAGQMGIQSIPAVVAFVDGRPSDGFMGVQTEAQISAFIERMAGPIGPSDTEMDLANAQTAFDHGDINSAIQLYSAVLAKEAHNHTAIAGLAACYVAANNIEQAKQILQMVPEAQLSDPAFARINAQIELIEQTAHLGDPVKLAERLSQNGNDHAARFDLALILNAHGNTENTVKELVEIVRRDKSWEDDKARKQLLQFFEAWGPTAPQTIHGRRALSAVLFS